MTTQFYAWPTIRYDGTLNYSEIQGIHATNKEEAITLFMKALEPKNDDPFDKLLNKMIEEKTKNDTVFDIEYFLRNTNTILPIEK
jgi:hypothetical protein